MVINNNKSSKEYNSVKHLSKGYVQLYFGDGKGKTTAAIGLAIRAAGCGLKVFIAQFIKGLAYSEIKCLKKLSENITLKQYGRGCFIRNEPVDEDILAAKKGLKEVKEIILSGKFDVIILDEITIAQHFNLISIDDILELVRLKPNNVELILTGRKADKRIIDASDLVTEMKEIKHYYANGVLARKGIEK